MKALTKVAWTGTLAILLFGLAFLPVLHLRQAYSAVFRTQAAILLAIQTNRHTVGFLPQPDPLNDNDVLVVITTKGEPRALSVAFKSLFGFIPTTLFAILVVLTPLRLSRRLHALLVGGLWVEAYVLLGTALTWLRAWSVHARDCPQSHANFLRSGTWWETLDLVDAVLTRAPSLNILVAVLAWYWATSRSWSGLPFARNVESAKVPVL